MAWVQPRHVPGRQPAVRQLVRDDDVPRLAHGVATRARRPRPSEKITLPIVSRSSPQGHPGLHSPPRGKAGSARPQGWLGPNRYMSPLGPRVIFEACGENEMPGLAFGLATRTRRARPSDKTASRAVSGPSSVRPSVLGLPPAEGRALHARKEWWRLIEACALLATGSSSTHPRE
jgi:hypothetical protein